MARAVYSASKMYLNENNEIEIIYLYLKEDSEIGYTLTLSRNDKIEELLISRSTIFDKKERKRIVKLITSEHLHKLLIRLNINLLNEEMLDFIEKLKGNF